MYRVIIPIVAALLFCAYCAEQQAVDTIQGHKSALIDELTGANDGQN